jgi:hypothetical protein
VTDKPGAKPADKPVEIKRPTNPDLKVQRTSDKYLEQADDNRALGENMGGVTGAHQVATGETAPEVSQGAWRERAFMPRATMGHGEMTAALKTSIDTARTSPSPVGLVFVHLRADWLPVLRQAAEQAAGDGIDCWLLSALKPPGKVAKSPLLQELIAAFEKMRAASTTETMLTAAADVVSAVERATVAPKKVSFKQMELLLEGKVEIHELLLILFCDDQELKTRLAEIAGTMDTIRGQLKSMPGAKPDGMYSNFTRLKAEAKVLTAELTRRHLASKVIPP